MFEKEDDGYESDVQAEAADQLITFLLGEAASRNNRRFQLMMARNSPPLEPLVQHHTIPRTGLEGLWYTIHRHPGLFSQLWTEIQAGFEVLHDVERMAQWDYIFGIVQQVVEENVSIPGPIPATRYPHYGDRALTGGDSLPFESLPNYLSDMEGVRGPGVALTLREAQAYRVAGPLFDCAYLMFKCAEVMHNHGPAHVNASLFSEVVGDLGGCWSLLSDRSEIRDWFLWERVFGNAIRQCRDRDVAPLRLLSAMLLCQPLATIRQVFAGPEAAEMAWDGDEWRDYNKCLLVTNNLRQDLGAVDCHWRLESVTDAELLTRWREPRYD